MRNGNRSRLVLSGAVFGAALIALAASSRVADAQDVSRCGAGAGPLCQEIETCRNLPFVKRCGTSYSYYP